MKKKIFIFFIFLVFLYTSYVFANEQLCDGWHVVAKNEEANREKDWDSQSKAWTYYENGKELMRFTRLAASHRGWGTAPENSLESFKATKENGYYAIENDIRFTSDGVPVVIHDAKINNVARNNDLSVIEEDVFVNSITYDELKSNYVFNIDRGNHDTPTALEGYETNRITTFEEMLNYVKANNMFAFIELKDGTKEQIESLVKSTQQKNMHNNVMWISFYTDLLKYVRDYDDDELLHVNKTTNCDDNHNLYCGQDEEYYLNKLKTPNNIVSIAYYANNTAGFTAPDLPSQQSESNSPQHFALDTIPQGIVTVSNNNLNLDVGSEQTISYAYDGDGIIKCESSNASKLTCTVDNSNHQVTIRSTGDDSISEVVTIYSTQGISSSASDDVEVQVSVEDEATKAKKHLRNIQINGYNFDFDTETQNYKVKINDEDELKIDVSIDSELYSSAIVGNKNLENGSVVKVNILNSNGDVVLTYNFTIEKRLITQIVENIPNTLKSKSILSFIISFITLSIGVIIIISQKKVKNN